MEKATAQPVLFETKSFSHFRLFYEKSDYSQVFVLVDTNTEKHCLPVLQEQFSALETSFTILRVKAGESSKSLEVCSYLWTVLSQEEADRKSLLINLGGGMITDLGGFVASVYKRGIDFINFPTSLLAMVDASVGGKCGIDFNGFKNQLGVFKEAEACFVYTDFLNTLAEGELVSGYAELVKHALIAPEVSLSEIKSVRSLPSATLVKKAILTKQKIVEQDPLEKGERKKLNFGHTLGHAIESYFLEKGNEIPHGYAVAAGMWCELYLSVKKELIDQELAAKYSAFIRQEFPKVTFQKSDLPGIMNFLKQDKKNVNGQLRFSLLNGEGSAIIDQPVEEKLIEQSLEKYMEAYG